MARMAWLWKNENMAKILKKCSFGTFVGTLGKYSKKYSPGDPLRQKTLQKYSPGLFLECFSHKIENPKGAAGGRPSILGEKHSKNSPGEYFWSIFWRRGSPREHFLEYFLRAPTKVPKEYFFCILCVFLFFYNLATRDRCKSRPCFNMPTVHYRRRCGRTYTSSVSTTKILTIMITLYCIPLGAG